MRTTRLSSAALAVVAWFRSWIATAANYRRLAAKCRALALELEDARKQAERELVGKERAQADFAEAAHARDMLEGRVDVLRGQIEEMVSYQNANKELADSIAARAVLLRQRGGTEEP